jgi:hypothetical protein
MGQTVGDFITYWKGASGGERSQSQSFLSGLCRVFGLAEPKEGDYKFEYPVRGDAGTDFIDLYKRGCFVLEAKQSRAKGNKKAVVGQSDMFATVDTAKPGSARSNFDILMLNARQQAENYARHLPASHEWPPFIVVCDVGHCFELYADFTGKGRNYSQFPDRQGFRVYLDDLHKPEIQELFTKLWTDPHGLDPTKRAAKATREIANRLAEVSKRLEAKKHPPEEVALFLMRCIFTMFAEDTELMPKGAFTELLEDCANDSQAFVPLVDELWKRMNGGGFSTSIKAKVREFNGNLFADAKVFPMGREDIGELKEAAKQDWREVDPSIFGTLLEQALDPQERSRLGAHYTPRAYVERLVIATIIEPLREKWNNVQGSLELDPKDALARVTAFHRELCELRILDPACGTGNFLYVSLELLKRLEGEVLDMIERLGGQEALRLEKFTIDPHQFLGLEINPRAAAIAELVLWIGYLRWHLRTKGEAPPEPILREFKNIEKKDAVLAHDGFDAKGNYLRPRRPEWPEADYIVGNPPFIGKGEPMREALGDHYVEALWSAHRHMNESADFVMFWWDRAAELLTRKSTRLKRFGLVTTNSIKQVFNRRVVERHLASKEPASLLMAIDDHPWTKATRDSASVRIAMTVAAAGRHSGLLRKVVAEHELDTDEPHIEFADQTGKINADLTVGADLTSCDVLKANEGIACNGMMLAGRGFVLTRSEAEHLGTGNPQNDMVIKPYINGGELVRARAGRFVIDLFGQEIEHVRDRYPQIYQHLLRAVKPERDQNRRPAFKRRWWVFGEPRRTFRPALVGLRSYIGTTETAKHRVFQFLDSRLVPDHMIIAIASADAFHLGVLSSRIHVAWTLMQGGTLEDRPRYTKSHCFDLFPFPDSDPLARARIADLGERLDRHRKDVQAAHPEITLTAMYNVLEKLKAKAALSPAEDTILKDGLVLILKELHDELDDAAAEAYGWPKDLSDEEILARLVALNKERAAEEARGQVRWLRPDYQIPRFGTPKEKQEQLEAELAVAVAPKAKPAFPQDPVAQTAAIMSALAAAPEPLGATELAQGFKQGRKSEARIKAALASLARTGLIAVHDGGRRFSLRRAA